LYCNWDDNNFLTELSRIFPYFIIILFLLYTSFILVNIILRCNCCIFLCRPTFVGGILASSFAFYVYTDYNINCVFRAASDFLFLTLAERHFHIKDIDTISEQKLKYTAGNVTHRNFFWLEITTLLSKI